MAQLTEKEIVDSVIAAHGALHLLTIALVEKEAIEDDKALGALELLASSNSITKKNTADAIDKLKQIVALRSKTS